MTMYNSGVHSAYLKSHVFGLDLGTPLGWSATIRLVPADQEKLIVYPNGQVRIEGPTISGTEGLALSIGGYGDVQVDASGLAGGRFAVRENGNVGIGNPYPFEKLDVFGNIRANRYKHVTPKTYLYTVDPAAFRAITSAVQSNIDQGVYLEISATYTSLVAPVNLPDNSTVTRISVRFYDAVPGADITLYLYGYDSNGFYTLQSPFIQSSGSSGYSLVQSAPLSTVINNNTFSYGILTASNIIWPGSSMKIRAVIIEYTVAEL